MQIPLQITFRDMEPSAAVESVGCAMRTMNQQLEFFSGAHGAPYNRSLNKSEFP
jgi:hypothetical protein